jgi:hypothetical protein
MVDMKPRAGQKKPPDIGETPRYHLSGLLTGGVAPTDAERKHLQGRGVLGIFATVFEDLPIFWHDVGAVRDGLGAVDPTAPDAPARRANPAWTMSLSYGVQGGDHRMLITAMLINAAKEPDREAASAAMIRLGEGPVRLDGEARGRARHDVTRIVKGARTVASYRAGRCGMPDCKELRQKRYCRRHGDQPAIRKQLEQARLWALDLAVEALFQTATVSRPGEYAWWLIQPGGRSRSSHRDRPERYSTVVLG